MADVRCGLCKWIAGRSRRLLLVVAICFFTLYLMSLWSSKERLSSVVPAALALLAKNMEANSNDSVWVPEGVMRLDYVPAFVNNSLLRCLPSSSYMDMGPCKDSLRFQSTTNPLTALVSFPGAGNTWTRYLLEQSTGILTGSKYCDRSLKKFFYAENVVSSNVLVVKSHVGRGGAHLRLDAHLGLRQDKYDKAIVLVRHPMDAIISEANRYFNQGQAGKHTSVLKKKFFESKQWEEFVAQSSYRWASMYQYWLSPTVQLPVLVVQYEKMVNNLEVELQRMLKFLDVKYSEEDFLCVMANPYGHFKRSKHLEFNPYTPQQSALIEKYITSLAPLLSQYDIVYT